MAEPKRESKKDRIERIAHEAYETLLPKAQKLGWALNATKGWVENVETDAQRQWKAAVAVIIDILEREAKARAVIPSALCEMFDNAKDAREYIMKQIVVFQGIESKSCDEIAWIALKLSCTRKAALKCIDWARRG